MMKGYEIMSITDSSDKEAESNTIINTSAASNINSYNITIAQTDSNQDQQQKYESSINQ